ncbi:MAG: response regulator transcription factor [Rhodocyclaceae bacterium]|nr:response regulator transcription factor [Rhodocyclaceae bacterium]MCP5231639.1 response regulator transcription factor [Zoogloeaceae bacterium]MCB1912726.1 response regulator transcription factor [Rhodocyclaceae bacterium]MCP5240021.1 response regulator transcription factor [Zoogloeaceae bacterium]MCP5253750.1 response regulator transcription factor [Zoogloeaceae bacterium]
MKILIVEDDAAQGRFLQKGLREAGHLTQLARDGRDGLFLATTESFDAIVLDRMLPRVDGLTVLRTLRASGKELPVIVLSALGEVDERIEGLRAGGDDYLAKPFSISELLARLEALQRRSASAARPSQATTLRLGDLEMNLLRRTVRRAGRDIELKPKAFALLEYLMRHADQVVTRSMLLEAVWDYHFDPRTNVIDVHVSNLRAAIDAPGLPPLIHTVRGAGYLLGLRGD